MISEILTPEEHEILRAYRLFRDSKEIYQMSNEDEREDNFNKMQTREIDFLMCAGAQDYWLDNLI